jgi:DNA polymerase epsilon subunit 1
MPGLAEFPVVPLEGNTANDAFANAGIRNEAAELLTRLEWQRMGSRAMLRRYLEMPMALEVRIRQCRYLHVPLGNLPALPGDAALFATDVMFARHLLRNNFLLWCSTTDAPDLGGREADDYT